MTHPFFLTSAQGAVGTLSSANYLLCSILALALLGWRQVDIAAELGCRQTYVSQVSLRFGVRRHTARHTSSPKLSRRRRISLRSAAGNGIMVG